MGTTAGTRRAGRLCGQVCPAWPASASLRAQSQTVRRNLGRGARGAPVAGVPVAGVALAPVAGARVAVLPQPTTTRLVIAAK